MKRNEDGEIRPSLEEPGVGFSDLGEVTITRGRALKLAGAALAGSALSLVWAGEADARRKRRRRRKRKAKVNNFTDGDVLTVIAGALNPNLLNVTNESDKVLTIEKVELLDKKGNVIEANVLTDPVTIDAGETKDVDVDLLDLDAQDLVNADKLRLIDGRGMPITVIDKDGVEVGKDIPIEVDVL